MSFRPMSTVHRRATGRACVTMIALLMGATLSMWPGVGATAASPLNVSGTYSSVYHCKTGWCAGQDFPATTTYRQAAGSNVVYDGTNAGTLTGNVLTIHEVQGSYSWTSVLTFAADGKSWTGTTTDSNNTSGIDVGTLTSASAVTSLTGTWNCCGAGGASAQNFVINGTTGIAQFPNGSTFANLAATLNGNQVTIVTTYTNSTYVAHFTGTLTGSTISGTWSSNSNQSGTFTATLASTTPPVTTTTVLPAVATPTQVLPLASTISTPGAVFHSMKHNLLNAAITVGVIIFITFPANIFNRTFSANYEEIILILAGWRRRYHLPFGPKEPTAVTPNPDEDTTTAKMEEPGKVTAWGFAVVLILGAILGGLLNPHFGLNRSSGEGILATLISFSIGAVLSWYVAQRFRRYHQYPTLSYLQALPLGLVIAIICVAVSRLSHFEPGYLYGVVVGLSFAGSLKDNHNAHLTAISVGSTLVIALAAWFVWIPVNHLAQTHGTNALVVVLDDVLGSIFVGGLVGSVISLIPIDFLPGKIIAKWHRGAWAAIFFVATFLLIEVELRPDSGSTHPGHASLATVVALFVLFGGATFWMRWYFERRAHLKVAATDAVATAVEETEAT